VLAGEGHLPPAASLILLHAGDAVVTGVIQLHLTIASFHPQPPLISKECVARLVLAAS
jgi:hypothetical protein